MDNNMLERAELALAKKKKRSIWLRIVSVLGCVVVFCTTYALILPAITMNRQTFCGLEEHIHTEQCYEIRTVEGETVLSCSAEEELHTHSDSCYDSNHVPVCGYANYYVHVHNSNCYEGETLVCDLQEIKEHTHEGNCYESEQKLICTLEEGGETHTHDDACYSEEKTLVCELEEGGEVHVHEDGCYAQEQTLTCGQEEAEGVHAHSEECYTTESRLICEKEEKTKVHTHTDECYNITSTLICEKEEVTQTHTHGEDCYETVETLTCRKTEVKLHTHGSSCFRTEDDGSETLVCTQVQVLEHVHSDSCFAAKTEQVLICGLEEHTHVDECYPVEETTEPTENETIPTEGEAVPTEGETTPAGDENAPTEGETTPIENESEPAEDETVPTETVPAEETTPAGDGSLSAEVEETAPVFLADGSTAVASGTCGDNLTWTITELDGVRTLTISGKGAMVNYTYVTGVPWYSYQSSIEEIIIGEGVTTIGDYAFYDCTELTSINIPGGLTSIGGSAFGHCNKLASIDIPDSVKSIGNWTFSGCNSLISIVIPKGVTTIGTGMFYGCNSLVSFDIPEGVKSIEMEAFSDCTSLTDINIPEGVTSIRGYAFYRCISLKSVYLPESVTSLEYGVFSGCSSLETVNIPEKVTYIDYATFSGCSSMTSITIPDSVTAIGSGAFSGCTNLTTIDFPTGLITIERNGFSGCGNFDLLAGDYYVDDQKVMYNLLPGMAIVAYQPDGASILDTIVNEETGERLPVIQGDIVGSGSAGTSVYWIRLSTETEDVLYIYGSGSMSNEIYDNTHWQGIDRIVIKKGVTSIGDFAFSGISSLKSIDFADTVIRIGESCFANCTNLTSIDIPDSVSSIVYGAFRKCSGLTSVNLPTGQVTIGSSVFDLCSNLDDSLQNLTSGSYYIDNQDIIYSLKGGIAFSQYIPDGAYVPEMFVDENGVEYPVVVGTFVDSGTAGTRVYWIIYSTETEDVLYIYGSGVMTRFLTSSSAPWYNYRTQIDRIQIGKGVTSISLYAFTGCSSVKSVSIPESVTSIDRYAFRGCSSLTSIDIPEGVTAIEDYTFSSCSSLTSVSIPKGVTSIGYDAFRDCSSLTSIDIPEGVKSIAMYVFYNCRSLESVNIPDSVTSIGDSAFWNCSSLTGIDIPESVTSISFSAFSGCSSLTDITIPDGVTLINNYTFRDCSSLKSINLPDYMTSIGNAAFYNCSSLTSIDIPDGVTAIADNTFYGCSSLERVMIPEGVISIGTSAFYNCSSLTSIDLPDTVQAFNQYSFYGCSSATSINIPEGVTAIPSWTFQNCSSLTSIRFPASLKTIDYNAFSGCTDLETIYMDASQMTSCNVAFTGCSSLKNIVVGKNVDALYTNLVSRITNNTGKTIDNFNITFEGPNYFMLDANYQFGEDLSFLAAGNNYFVDENGAIYLVDNGVAYYLYSPMSAYIAPKTIPTEAFDGTTYPVYSTKLPDVVKHNDGLTWFVYEGEELVITGACDIPNYNETGAPWYSYGSEIKEIVLADTITGIGNFAFNGFSRVTEVDIPRDATTVSTSAFRNCDSLRNFVLDAENTAFSEVNGILYNPEQTTLILCPTAKRSATDIPATVTTIGNYSFAFNDSLTGVTLPEGVTTIEANAFYDCDGLKRITIPGETVTVGENAFYDCDGLTTVRVTAADAEIGKNAFYDCDAVTAVTVTSQASAIGEGAFRSCDALQKLDIRSETVTLGEYAFYDCAALEQVSLEILPADIPAHAFGNCGAMTAFNVPSGYTVIGEGAFEGVQLAPWSQVKSGLHYVDEQGALYWICDGLAYYVGCPETVEDYQLLSQTPQIGEYGPYAVDTDSTAGDFLDYGTTGPLYWYVVDDNDRQTLVITGEGEMPNYSGADGTPWKNYRTKIDDTVIEKGVESIGNSAFAHFDALRAATIPDSVTTIGPNAFYFCAGLKEIVIPDSVTKIADMAFYQCFALESVNIPASVTSIGPYAFLSCASIKTIEIPESVTQLSWYAFRNCSSLEEVTFSANITTIEPSVFEGCSKLKSIVIPDSVTSISRDVFKGCSSLTEIVIPDSVTGMSTNIFNGCTSLENVTLSANLKTIPEGTFQNCTSLKAIEIPDGVTSIGKNAFLNCAELAQIVLPEGYVTVDATAFSGTPLDYLAGTIYTDTNGVQYKIIDSKAYVVFQPEGVTDDMIPDYIDETGNNYPVVKDSVILASGKCGANLYWEILKSADSETLRIYGTGKMYDYSYSGTKSTAPWYEYREVIDALVIDEGATSIGAHAFRDCTAITEAALPDSMLTFGHNAFASCTGLREIIIPNSVTSVGTWTFSGCVNLTSVKLPEELTVIGDGVFGACKSLREITIPNTVTSLGTQSFKLCNSLTEVTIPGSVKSIGGDAFRECNGLTKVTMEEGVQSIGESAFNYCPALTEVTLPNGLTTIGNSAFSGCSALKQIDIPDSVTTIGDSAFSKCTSLTEFIFPKGVTTSSGGVLSDSRAIISLTFGENMTSLGRSFYALHNMKAIYLKAAKLSEVNELAFHYTGNVKLVMVEPGVDTLYSPMFEVLHNWNNKPSVEFTGPNYFSIDPDFLQETWNKLTGSLLHLMAPGGSYYIDEQGVLYQISDGAATLLHVPAGITEFSVPGTIPAADEGEETVPVIGVGAGALEAATDLTALVFEGPEAITNLADGCMANCPTLLSVNGKTTVREAKEIFTNENLTMGEGILENTGLVSELEEWLSQRQTSEENVVVSGEGVKATVITSTEQNAATEGNLAFYTGQLAKISVFYERTGENSSETVRVYFHFSEPGMSYSPALGQKEYDAVTLDGADSYKFQVTIGKLPYTNIYYLDLPVLKPGHTVEIPVETLYPSGSSGGGELRIWAEVIENEETTVVSTGTQKLTWETEPFDFSLTKKVRTQPKFSGDGTEGSSFAIYDLSYEVKLSPVGNSRNAPSGLGYDAMTRAEFVDVLTFPADERGQKLKWADGVTEAVANGDWTVEQYKNTNGGHIGWQVIVNIGGESRMLLAVQDKTATDLKVWLTDTGDIAFGWTRANSNINTVNPTFTHYVDVGDGMIVGESIKELYEDKSFQLRNDVNATQYFRYSGTQTDDAYCAHTAATNAAVMEAKKIADRDAEQNADYVAYFGESYPYTITLKNTGTQHLHALNKIEDELPADLYITPENMFTMLTEGRDSEYLTITISEATIYNQLPAGLRVTGTNGTEYTPDIQNTSIKTWYHGMEREEVSGCIASTGAKFVLKQAEGGVSVSLNGGEARIASGKAKLQSLLFDLGYFVTPLAQYNVTWEFPEGTSMWSSEERDYHILSTVKDAFMAISWDHTWTPIWDGSEPVESKSMNANAAKISYMLSEGGAQVSGEPVEVPKETTLKRDFWVNTEYWTGTHDGSLELVEGGGLVNLCVSVDHDGTASYDMVPFVSQMTGAQMLVVRVSDNPHLAAEEYGLTVRTIGGIDYYLLDRDGEYPNVMIGGYLADCVKVDVNDNNPNDITTQMRWYLTNIKGSMEMHIDCKVLMVTNGEITDSSVFGVDNEVWLNDHQTHRLWASMGSKWSFASFDKQIVTNHVEGTSVHDVTDPDDETILHDGDSVTYRLKITGMLSSSSVQAGRTVIVPGTAIYDQLPKSTTDWEFGKNIQKIEYVYDDTQVDIEGLEKDCWTLTNVDPETGETEDDQQYIVWNDMFQIIYKETSTVYIYVTLDYPEGADWAEYCNSYGSDMLINTMYFSNDNESVRHSLDMSASAKLVKGVSSTGVWKNNTYYPSTDSNSRFNYASEDNLDRIVTYYVALYNDGNTRLYLDDIQDKLPVGFTYRNNSVTVASDIADIGDDLGQEVTYKKAVISTAVEKDTGNIRFTAGNGAKKDDGTYPGDLNYDEIYERYYLLPRGALVFSYQCFVGPGAEAGIRGTNTAAMAYFDYNLCGVNVGSSTVTAENAEQIFNNDGDCSVIADSTAGTYGFSSELGEGTQWLMSQVQVEKGNIVPGIEKRVSSVQSSHGNEMLSKTQATYYDYVTWEVTTSNIGTTPMRDYVLTDVMQQTYDFEGEIVYTIYYGSNYVDNKDLTISGTLFSMNDLKTNGVWNEASKQYTMSVDNKIFGLLDVSYTPHSKESPATLAIHFRSAKAAIPEGGESVLTVTTRNNETYMTSTYTNTCYVTPAQSWDERLVTTGVPESYNDKLSVRNSADIAVDSAYLTASLKEVTEKINPDNHADSDDEVNSIVLSSGQSVFTYTLKVQNTGQEKDVMEKLVIIDNLPEIGDHSALKDTDPRYSEFAVWLAENPNFTVTVGGETLEPGAYDLQFTTKTSFSDDDWAGIGTGWDAASAEARAFRIILTGTVNEEGTYSGTVVPANTLVTVSFDAMIRAEDLTDGNALPGEIAWNSFGYNYRLFGSNVELASIPGKVGVKLPSIPQMIKKLETPDGRAWKAEKEQTFSYLVYALDEGLDLPELEGLTEAQIGEELQKADARFTRVCLTVPEGASESELLVLKDLHHWSVANGVWTEGSEEWTWTQGGKYVFVELPIEVAEGEIEEYTFGTINGNHRNHFLYVHDQAETATIVGMNLRRVWNISLLKVSDGKQASPLSGAWFGLYGKAAPAEAPVLPDALRATMTEEEFQKLLTLEYTEGETTATWYLQKVDVSGSDGILLWQDLTDEQYLVQEIQAPEGYHYDDTVHVVQRPEDVIFNTANMSVVNRSGYEMPKSGGIGTNAVTTMGALLIAASGVMLLLLKRRRKGTKA